MLELLKIQQIFFELNTSLTQTYYLREVPKSLVMFQISNDLNKREKLHLNEWIKTLNISNYYWVSQKNLYFSFL